LGNILEIKFTVFLQVFDGYHFTYFVTRIVFTDRQLTMYPEYVIRNLVLCPLIGHVMGIIHE